MKTKKAMTPELIAIILLVVGLAVAVLFFIYLTTGGRNLLGNTSALNVTFR